jgi:hypothetical protein
VIDLRRPSKKFCSNKASKIQIVIWLVVTAVGNFEFERCVLASLATRARRKASKSKSAIEITIATTSADSLRSSLVPILLYKQTRKKFEK